MVLSTCVHIQTLSYCIDRIWTIWQLFFYVKCTQIGDKILMMSLILVCNKHISCTINTHFLNIKFKITKTSHATILDKNGQQDLQNMHVYSLTQT